MYWLVEEDEQLNVLINSGFKKAFIEVIPLSNNVHPALNDVSLVYIRPLNASKGYMLCVTHSETLSVLKTRVDELLLKFDILYCRNKKEILHYSFANLSKCSTICVINGASTSAPLSLIASSMPCVCGA